MKTNFLILTILFFTIFCYATLIAQQITPIVKFKVLNGKNEKVFLKCITETGYLKTDSAEITENRQEIFLKGTNQNAKVFTNYNLYTSVYGDLNIYLSIDTIEIEMDMAVKKNILYQYRDKNLKIRSSEPTIEMYNFLSGDLLLMKERNILKKTIDSLSLNSNLKMKTDSCILQKQKIDSSLYVLYYNQLKNMKYSLNYFTPLFNIKKYPQWRNNDPVLDSLLAKFSDNQNLVTEIVYLKSLWESEIKNKENIGKLASNFALKDNKKSEISLESLKGNYIILDFWASWCAPCRKAIPEIQKLNNLYNDKKVKIVMISIDENNEKWLNTIEKEKIGNLIQLIDENKEVQIKYNIVAVPATFLISPQGILLLSNTNLNEILTLLNDKLKNDSK